MLDAAALLAVCMLLFAFAPSDIVVAKTGETETAVRRASTAESSRLPGWDFMA